MRNQRILAVLLSCALILSAGTTVGFAEDAVGENAASEVSSSQADTSSEEAKEDTGSSEDASMEDGTQDADEKENMSSSSEASSSESSSEAPTENPETDNTSSSSETSSEKTDSESSSEASNEQTDINSSSDASSSEPTASDTDNPSSSEASVPEVVVDMASLDNITYQRVDELVEAPVPDMDVDAKDLEKSKDMNPDKQTLKEEINLNDLSKSKFRVGRSATQSYTGTIANEGEYIMLYPLTLQPSEMLQVTLKCPKNEALDYDLYLYQFDMETGNLLPTSIDGSPLVTHFDTYEDGSRKTVDEGVGTINKTTGVKKYAVQILAKKGGSATDEFELIVSTDGLNWADPLETNESPFHAYNVEGNKAVDGLALNITNDQDWFCMVVPNNNDYDKITVSAPKTTPKGELTSGYFDVEVYTTDGTSMQRLNPDSISGDEKTYTTIPGYYYVKVFSDGGTFSPSAYRLSMPGVLKAANCNYVFVSDQENPIQTGYPEGVGYWYKHNFSIKAQFTSASGYAVKGVPLTVNLELEQWRYDSNICSLSDTQPSGDNGIATVSFKPASEPGDHYALINGRFRHQYAIDSIEISAPGLGTSTGKIYHLFRTV